MATRIGALPYRNSEREQTGQPFRNGALGWESQLTGRSPRPLTVKDPVPLLLALVSVDSHRRPPVTHRLGRQQNEGAQARARPRAPGLTPPAAVRVRQPPQPWRPKMDARGRQRVANGAFKTHNIIGERKSCAPVSPHPPGQLVTASFGLHKNDGLVFLFAHYFLQQTDQPVRIKEG